MSSDPWRIALASIKERFGKAADRFPRLRHRIFEITGDFTTAFESVPNRLRERFTLSSDPCPSMFWVDSEGRVRPRSLSEIEEELDKRDGLKVLSSHDSNWVMVSGIYYDAIPDEFRHLGEQAWKLIKGRPELVPVPKLILDVFSKANPNNEWSLPEWGTPHDSWAHVVHWIGRAHSHPVFRLVTGTWFGGIATSASEENLDGIRRKYANSHRHLVPDFDGPSPRVFSEIPDLVTSSIWALEWLDELSIKTSAKQLAGGNDFDLVFTDKNGKLIIILDGLENKPVVRGIEKKRLTKGQYAVVTALIKAYPNRLATDSLARQSDTEDPVGFIDRLIEDEDWRSVLDKPGSSHGGYGLRLSRPKVTQKRPETPKKPTKKTQ